MNKEQKEVIKNEIKELRAAMKSHTNEELTGSFMSDYAADSQARIQAILDAEEAAFEKMPESVQYSTKGEIAEECIGLLEEAADAYDELLAMLEEGGYEASDVKALVYDEIVGILEDLVR